MTFTAVSAVTAAAADDDNEMMQSFTSNRCRQQALDDLTVT